MQTSYLDGLVADEHERLKSKPAISGVDELLLSTVKQGRTPDTTLKCIQHLRRRLPRSRISVEVEKPGRPRLRELAGDADVVFYSKSWAEVSWNLW